MTAKKKNGRPTIGLLTTLISGDTNYEQSMWQGVFAVTQERNYNFMAFAGDLIRFDGRHQYSNAKNTIYNYVKHQELDGIIISSSTLSNNLSVKEFTDFCGQYSSVPMVSVGETPLSIPKSLIDNRKGMHDIISHLIETHGKRRIAFIRGSEGNDDAKQRYEVYLEVLKEYHLPFDQDLIYIGNFAEPSGSAAIKTFMDERKVVFDAVVASNDQMAFGAIKELQARGVHVPKEIAVTGFDNSEASASNDPPLSTVAQPVLKQSRRGGEMLIDLIEQKEVEKISYLPTELVVRQSCGCLPSSVVRAEMHYTDFVPMVYTKEAYLIKANEAVAQIQREIPEMGSGRYSKMLFMLFDSLAAEIFESGQAIFIQVFDKALNALFHSKDDLSNWQNALSIMRYTVGPYIRNESERFRFENIFQQARALAGDFSARTQANKLSKFEQENALLRYVIMNASANFEKKELLPVLKRELPRLNIPSGIVSVFAGSQNLLDESEIFLAFQREGDFKQAGIAQRYKAEELIPEAFWQNRPQGFLISSLIYMNKPLGVSALEIGSLSGFIYDAVNSQLSSSIKASMLLESTRVSEKASADRSAEIETLVGPMLESIKAITKDLQERMKQVKEINQLTRTSLEKVSATNTIIEKVATSISKMSDIINMIDEISVKVNMVALNASIESTHAGHYGSGFAVIAKEIKKLSDSTKKNAGEVSVTIQHVIKNIKESLVTGKESLETFQQQEKGVNDILNALAAIASQMDKLNSSSQDILRVMKGDHTPS